MSSHFAPPRNKWQEQKALSGKLLVSMPALTDPNFNRTLVFICAHSQEGAMGLVLTRHHNAPTLDSLITQITLGNKLMKSWQNSKRDFPDETKLKTNFSILYGGPVDKGRGYILHSRDTEFSNQTMAVTETLGLTTTVEMLLAIRRNQGPSKAILAMGCAGWGSGQLEDEINDNAWLVINPDDDLIFDDDYDCKYMKALANIGIKDVHLVAQSGNA